MNDGGEIWGVEIEGKRGFVNRRHIQETRIFKSQLGHRVTEGNGSNSERNEPVNYVVDKNSDRPEPQNIEKDISMNPQSKINPLITLKKFLILLKRQLQKKPRIQKGYIPQ